MREYIYFASSLPFLRYGAESPLSVERFLLSCSTVLERSDYQALEALSRRRGPSEMAAAGGKLAEYFTWEIALRNEIALYRLKAGRSRLERSKPIETDAGTRPGGSGSVLLSHALAKIWSQNPYEREVSIDRLRWGRLDELSATSYFDMRFLGAYLLKLELLGRSASWNREEGRRRYGEISQKILAAERGVVE